MEEGWEWIWRRGVCRSQGARGWSVKSDGGHSDVTMVQLKENVCVKCRIVML